MDSDHQVVALGRLVDRPVVALAERHLGTHQKARLYEAGMVAKPFDLFRSHLGILGRHDNGGTQPGLLIEPLCDLPVVHGPSHGPAQSSLWTSWTPYRQLRMAYSTSHESRSCPRRRSRSEPGGPPEGGTAP